MATKAKGKNRKERAKVSAKRRMKEHKKGGSGSSYLNIPDGMKQYQLQGEGYRKIEICSYTAGVGNPYADEGEIYWERTFFVHKGIGPDKSSYVCPARTANKPCPICEHRAKLNWDDDEEQMKAIKAKERQLILLVDHKEKDKGVQLWDISSYLFGDLLQGKLEKLESDEDTKRDFTVFPDPDDGYTLKLEYETEESPFGKFAKITGIEFKPRTFDVAEEYPVEDNPCLDEMLVIHDYKTLKKIFLQVEEGEDEDEKPAKKGKASGKGKKEPEPEEDEDEDDDFEDEDEDVEDEEDAIIVSDIVTYKGEEYEVIKIEKNGKLVLENEEGKKKKNVDPKDVTVEAAEEDEEDEEEEEAPKKGKGKATAKKGKKEPEPEEEDEEDDDDWDDDWDDEDEPEEEDEEEEEEVKPAKKGKGKKK